MKRVAFWCLWCAGAAAAERPEDFAYGARMELQPGAAAYEAPLSVDVYRHAAFADLRDVRVFNGAGESVPFAIRIPPTPDAERRGLQSVSIFPLRGDTQQALDALRITVAGNRASVQVDTPARSDVLRGYLIDTRAQSESIVALELQWPENAPPFATTLTVAASDDLRQWRTLTVDAPVVNLQFAGERLQQRRVELSATKAKFLRLTWPESATPVELRSLSIEPAAARVDPQRLQAESVGRAIGNGVFEFDLEVRASVDRLMLSLPQPNSLTVASFASRSSAATPWRYVTQSTVYRLQRDARELASPPIAIAANSDRFWQVRVDERGIGSGVVRLAVAWPRASAVFLARGNAPFTLAVGNAAAVQSQYPLPSVIGAAGVAPAAARLGDFMDLGGPLRLQQSAPIQWKSYALWTVLLVAVAALSIMARRLLREMNAVDRR